MPVCHCRLAWPCLNAGLLYWQLRRQKIFTPQPGWFLFLLRLVIAVIVMSAALLGVMYLMPEWSQGTMPFRLLRLMVVVVAGVVAYLPDGSLRRNDSRAFYQADAEGDSAGNDGESHYTAPACYHIQFASQH